MPSLPALDPHYTAHLGATPMTGLSVLWRMAFAGGGVSGPGAQLIERAERSGDLYALLELSDVLQLEFRRDTALKVQAMTLKAQQLFRLSQGRADTALRVLVLKAAGDLMSNTPFELLLDDHDLTVDVLYVEAGQPLPPVLPEHDVLWVIVAQSESNRALLMELAALLPYWPRPVLNAPARIAGLARDLLAQALSDAPGAVMPAIRRVSRADLEQLGAGLLPPAALLPAAHFPLLVRPLDSHAGNGLLRIDHAEQLQPYLEQHSAAMFYVGHFIDYASPDGLYRKFRVAFIDGAPYLCHMGVSAHWMVHYPYEEMIAHPSRRAEEAAQLAGFSHGFGLRHTTALHTVQQRVGLDYWGIDCAETPDGRLLVFEASNAMLIHRMDPEDLFPYKTPHMTTVFAAVYGMLQSAAARHGTHGPV
jgi:hypothetical protein